jgi:hypothetical protein
MKSKAIFVRIDPVKHRLFSQLVASWGISMTAAIEGMIDQILYQTVYGYDAPQWLRDAVESGDLPIQPCGDDDSPEPFENVVRLVGLR